MDIAWDTLGTGLTHKKEVCDSCDHRSINGIRFTCTECPNYSLCAICYGDDEHDLNHSFLRYLDVNSESVQFSPRRWSHKWPITGIFVGAEVVRGPDWINGNEYGGYGTKGYIIKIKRNIKTNGNYAIVTWDNGFTNDYQLDFQYLKPSNRHYFYYYDHMPILLEPSQQPFYFPDHNMQPTNYYSFVFISFIRRFSHYFHTLILVKPDYSQCPPDFPDHNNRNSLRDENCQSRSYISPGSGTQKGSLIIFNQEEFKDSDLNRKGSNKDEEALLSTFRKFNFETAVKRNLPFSEIKKVVRVLSDTDFSKSTCLVAVIMSHGDCNGTIYAYDQKFHVDTDFIGKIVQNPTLRGKPKIFIIVACKGSNQISPNSDKLTTDCGDRSRRMMIPTFRDILTCFSTYEGYVSYRDEYKGTCFIQTLCDILDKDGVRLSIQDIMQKVTKRLSDNYGYQQVPTTESTMIYHFCFGDIIKKY